MKRHLAPSLFALCVCALPGGTRAAHAQSAGAIVPAAIDVVGVAARIDSAGVIATSDSVTVTTRIDSVAVPLVNVATTVERRDAVHAASLALSPIIQPVSPVFARDVTGEPPARSHDFAAMQGRDWKMPTSRSLMIGGTVAVIAGLALVGGDTGAIIAMTGGAVAVYGLYLHYNR